MKFPKPKKSRRFSSPETSQTLAMFLLVFLALVLAMTYLLQAEVFPETGDFPVDFDLFHKVGQMIRDGRFAAAYGAHVAPQGDVPELPMPFAYPPQHGLLLWPLGWLPEGVAHMAFVGLPLVVYLIALGRLAGFYFPAVLLAATPVIAINILNGQNGLLTGALGGVFALAFVNGQRRAGVPAALMVLKPHLAVGFALLPLVGRHWGIVASALVTLAVVTLGAHLAFGADIWSAFSGAAEAARARFEGAGAGFAVNRMTSAYALAFTLGAGQTLALAIHVLVALVALGVAGTLAWRCGLEELPLGAALLATLAVSPYVFDYDLPILFAGLAVLAPGIMIRAHWPERLLLLLLLWLATAQGMVLGLWLGPWLGEAGGGLMGRPEALGAAGYLGTLILVALILRREPLALSRAQHEPAPQETD